MPRNFWFAFFVNLFVYRMPASIERSIREENLRFMQNRDVFSEDYYRCSVLRSLSFLPGIYCKVLWAMLSRPGKAKSYWTNVFVTH